MMFDIGAKNWKKYQTLSRESTATLIAKAKTLRVNGLSDNEGRFCNDAFIADPYAHSLQTPRQANLKRKI